MRGRLLLFCILASMGCSKSKLDWNPKGTATNGSQVAPIFGGGPVDFGNGSVQAKARFMDRTAMVSILTSIFANGTPGSTVARDIILKNIKGQVDQYNQPTTTGGTQVFGSPVDPYEEFWIKDGSNLKPQRGIAGCQKSGQDASSIGLCMETNINMPAMPSSTALRSGVQFQTCNALVNNAEGLSTAMNKIGGSGFTKDDVKMTKAYNLFYPGRLAPQPVLDALYAAGYAAYTQTPAPSAPGTEAWKLIFLTLCTAPGWTTI